jgi:hypothetical protein
VSSNKRASIYLVSGETLETTKQDVNYFAWGVTATVKGESNNRILQIPWGNILWVEEFIS